MHVTPISSQYWIYASLYHFFTLIYCALTYFWTVVFYQMRYHNYSPKTIEKIYDFKSLIQERFKKSRNKYDLKKKSNESMAKREHENDEAEDGYKINKYLNFLKQLISLLMFFFILVIDVVIWSLIVS